MVKFTPGQSLKYHKISHTFDYFIIFMTRCRSEKGVLVYFMGVYVYGLISFETLRFLYSALSCIGFTLLYCFYSSFLL